jgi:hypothetical protein
MMGMHTAAVSPPTGSKGSHEDLGFSGSTTPYRSRSAFASSVRPSASSASAVIGPGVVRFMGGEGGFAESECIGRTTNEKQ